LEDPPYGLIELVLVFGSILALAVWEVVRNRRELERMRRIRDGGEPPIP
jgi:hypothetical protein